MTDGPYHAGELAVQRRAGVSGMAARIGNGIRATMPPAAAAFLAERTWVVLATADALGRPWASVVSGAPGFALALEGIQGGSGVRLATRPAPGDPLEQNLGASTHAGLLAIDLATRRRMRVNGHLLPAGDGTIVLRAEQVYANCPKYIQRRERGAGQDPSAVPGTAHASAALNGRQREWLRRTDTFFVGTVNPGEGADASHRGGRPGFVEVEGDLIRWPDYPGNMMFNTLGNIEATRRAGMLVPDFQTGGGLLITGDARIDWSARGEDESRGVELAVREVVELDRVFEALRLVDYSPHLPER